MNLLLAALLISAPAGSPSRTAADTACVTMNTTNLPLATRKSPLDSVSFAVGGALAKVCYGRPSSRGRTMLGGEAIPYGRLWRTGANEPTMIHTTAPLTVAGVRVPAGSYSLYTVPGKTEWEVIVNRSIRQWGEESNYTERVKAQELGRGRVKSTRLAEPVETFTVRASPARGNASALVLEWERTRLSIPVAAGR